MSKEEATIGGLPAVRFLNRRIKVRGKERCQHGMPGVLYEISGRNAWVKTDGHKEANVKVDVSKITPWWSENPDLKAEMEALGMQAEEEETPEQQEPSAPDGSQAQDPLQSPLAQIGEKVRKANAAKEAFKAPAAAPRLVISTHSQEWIPVYQEYAALLESGRADMEMLDELMKSIRANQGRQGECLSRLKALGVEVQYPEGPAEPAPAPTPPAGSPEPEGKVLRTPPEEIRKKVDAWCKSVAEKILRGRGVFGTMGSWTKEAGVNQTSFMYHIDEFAHKHGIRIVAEDGSAEGSAARGKLKVLKKHN